VLYYPVAENRFYRAIIVADEQGCLWQVDYSITTAPACRLDFVTKTATLHMQTTMWRICSE